MSSNIEQYRANPVRGQQKTVDYDLTGYKWAGEIAYYSRQVQPVKDKGYSAVVFYCLEPAFGHCTPAGFSEWRVVGFPYNHRIGM